MRFMAGLLSGACSLVLQACASAPAGGLAGLRPQLDDAQVTRYARTAVLGDWDPPAEPAVFVAPHYRVDRSLPADGRTVFASVQAAILQAHGDGAAGARQRRVIGIAPGDYEEVVRLPAGSVPITLQGLGASASAVHIHFALHAGLSGADYAARVAAPARLVRCAVHERIGTFCTPVLAIERDGTELRNLTVQNDFRPAGNVEQQAVALAVEGADRVLLDGVQLLGHQDTLYLAKSAAGSSRSFVTRSLVAGDVDFIFGAGTAYFVASEIRFNGAERGRDAGFVAAPSTDLRTPHGFVFDDCDFTAVPGPRPQRVHLARQWFPGAACSPYGDHAAQCTIARDDASAARGELKPSALAAVGKMVVQRSRLGPHIAADEPWAPWQRDRAHPAYRPAQFDSAQFASALRAAGHDPARWGLALPQVPEPFLAEYRNQPAPE